MNIQRETSGTNGLIDLSAAETLPGLFLERLRRTPDRVAYREYDAAAATWRDHTWREMADRAGRFRAAMVGADLRPGDRVAVLLSNGIDWVAFDVAAMSLGLVVVPLYAHDSAASNAWLLANAAARLLVTDRWLRWRDLQSAATFADLEAVWIREEGDPSGAADHGGIAQPLGSVLSKRGEAVTCRVPSPQSTATIIYTSGTTGRPKGVMLSHQALLWNAAATTQRVPPRSDDVFLSHLPLAHAFERTVGYYVPMMAGCTVVFARSVDSLRDDMRTIRPTALISVPRLYERLHGAILRTAAGSRRRQRLLERTCALGWRVFEARHGRSPGLGIAERVEWLVLQRLVVQKVQQSLGGRLRIAVSGGATLSPEVGRALVALGVPLVEGYGLTEAGPVVTASPPGEYVPGGVGSPLERVELSLSEQGELIVQTPGLMIGYWRDEAATARAVDLDGWLHTGDIAEIHDGRVRIRGRLKDVIVLSTGEKANPGDIEEAIAREPLVRQALVTGEGRPFLAAAVVVEPVAWQALAAEIGVDAGDLTSARARAAVQKRIDARLKGFPRHAQVRAVHLSRDPWSIDAGLLTPTLKPKRRAIERLLETQIAELYSAHTPAR